MNSTASWRAASYGWPFWHADNRPDPEFGHHPAAAAGRTPIAPAYAFGAHVAALSIHFFDPPHAPPGFEHAALVGHHGCADCHGAGGAGKPLAGLASRYSVDQIEALLRAPPASMPAPPLDAGQRQTLAGNLRAAYPRGAVRS